MKEPSDKQSLEKLLSKHREAGEAIDEGEFTLDPSRLLEKMGSFALPSPQFWILKLAQASVLAGAESLSYRKSVHDLKVLASGGEWTSDNFRQDFYSSKLDGPEAVVHLKLALWSLARADFSFELTLPGHKSAYTWDDQKLEVKDVIPSVTLVLRVYRTVSNKGRLANVLGVSVADFQLLDEILKLRVTLSPLKLTLKKSARPQPHHLLGLRETALYLSLGSYRHSLQENDVWSKQAQFDPPPGYESPPVPANWSKQEPEEYFAWRGEAGLQAWTTCFVCFDSKEKLNIKPSFSSISWRRYGVIVEQEQLFRGKRALALDIIIDCDDLGADLGGFALRNKEKRRTEVLLSVLQALHELGPGSFSGWPEIFCRQDSPYYQRLLAPWLSVTLGSSVVTGLLGFGAGAICTMGLGMWVSYDRATQKSNSKARKIEETLVAAFQDIVSELRKKHWLSEGS